jgi:nicotinate-nucleotide--dimethylbenzimidazole phosphoribosyltransferase
MIEEALQQKINSKTKPPGALGVLETVALQIGNIQQSTAPVLTHPTIVVFAADHGIAATGLVNPYPQSVTAQMVRNFLSGGAAINVFCRQNNLHLLIADAGVKEDWTMEEQGHSQFLVRKVGYGTASYLDGKAMTTGQCAEAVEEGRAIVSEVASKGCNTIGFGEMGIGNTSSAALLMSSILQLPVEDCAGRGTGVDDRQMQTKLATLQTVARIHSIHTLDNRPLELLEAVGGLEIAMMTGAFLEAASRNMVIVVDGFIATAALLVAVKMDRAVLNNCIFAHCSAEGGHRKMIDHLGARPLLELGLRLGEGTGAALAMPLLKAAVSFLNEMASFESAGISSKA